MSKDVPIAEAWAIVQKIRPLLAGRGQIVQGAVLADLVATWVAGHGVIGDSEATAEIRDELLKMHVAIVRELIPQNAPAALKKKGKKT